MLFVSIFYSDHVGLLVPVVVPARFRRHHCVGSPRRQDVLHNGLVLVSVQRQVSGDAANQASRGGGDLVHVRPARHVVLDYWDDVKVR